MSDKPIAWRITMWFLTSYFGRFDWVQIGFAHMEAADEAHAGMVAAQRAAKLGFSVNKDTLIRIERESGKNLL